MFRITKISVHGVRLNFISNSDFYHDEILEDYKHFELNSIKDSNLDANVFFQIMNDLKSFPINFYGLKEAKLIKEILTDDLAEFSISVLDDSWIIINGMSGNVIFLANPDQEIYHGYSTVENLSVYHMLTDMIMNILTKKLIKKKIFSVHAAAASKNNAGILFPGKAGSGKTTLSIILTRLGYNFLSDDYPLILSKNSTFEIFAFPLRLKVRPDIIEQFSEFQIYTRRKGTRVKRPYIDITEIYANCLTRKAKLKFIAFPILTSGKSNYKQLSSEEALQRLLPCVFDPFPSVQKDTSIRKSIFEIAYSLVRNIKCYDLFLGKNHSQVLKTVDDIFDNND
ncbi:hypothetical protein [Candidatus Borrarchaeum sp.]|uniref:hypothetical protein n=1 Tax=Candidatus Borrarchaeum sp. TaxID=2846742 RepID=UPI00257D1F44|nr:hypothetical protein [Candidatus Borrarchaeum sp.]